jgi:hypothetical protein
VEPETDWYLEAGQGVQTPASRYSPESSNGVLFSQNVPAGQSAATSSLLPLSSVAASQQESKVIIRKAFNMIPVLACLKGDNRGRDLGTDLTKQMMTTRRTIAERKLLSMHVISINKQGGVAIVTPAAQGLLPEVMVQGLPEAPPQPSPMLQVGQSRQEVGPGAGKDMHPTGSQSFKPAPSAM